MVQVLVVRVDTGVVIYEAMTPQCGRSVVQVLVVRVDIGVVTYEAMTPQCGRSVVQVLGPVSPRSVLYDVLTMYLTKFKNIHTCVSQNVRKMVLNYK